MLLELTLNAFISTWSLTLSHEIPFPSAPVGAKN